MIDSSLPSTGSTTSLSEGQVGTHLWGATLRHFSSNQARQRRVVTAKPFVMLSAFVYNAMKGESQARQVFLHLLLRHRSHGSIRTEIPISQTICLQEEEGAIWFYISCQGYNAECGIIPRISLLKFQIETLCDLAAMTDLEYSVSKRHLLLSLPSLTLQHALILN